ncbi:MAG: hypothetical protein ABSD99_10910 [Candidatus Bathyarchaeia archaeon]
MSANPLDMMVGHYRFQDFTEDGNGVRCTVEYVRGAREGMTPDRQKEVDRILSDMGKWESLAKLTQDLKLSTQQGISPYFGRSLYDVQITQVGNDDGYRLWVKFSLTKEESLRRTNRKEAYLTPFRTEITDQITNLSKWKNFSDLLNYLKGSLNP